MALTTSKNRLSLPKRELKWQSPYFYLQSVGSTGADGSAEGVHVRWILCRNLGDSHIPKGDYAQSKVNFNRKDDFVTIVRSKYVERFPTIIDFAAGPSIVNDAMTFWIYANTNTATVVYVYFRDTAKYAAVRQALGPVANPLDFVKQYCPGLIEVEVKDKLFFAAEFDVERNSATVMRTEALSVESNVPLSPVFVSCRKVFTDRNWCPDSDKPVRPGGAAPVSAVVNPGGDIPSCCAGPNLLDNGGFELDAAGLGFETDYRFQAGPHAGVINITSDASQVNHAWRGLPHSGRFFLAVDGSEKKEAAVLRFRRQIELNTDYCFAGWLATLWDRDVSIPLQFRFISADGTVRSFYQNTPATVGTWEPFTFAWNSGASPIVTVEIISMSTKSIGNDFAIDDLWFCKGKQKECRARMVAENIRSIRFEVTGGYPRKLAIETYQDYMKGALWEALDKLALTTDDNTALSRLEPAGSVVNGRWLKFNGNARVNLANYKDRWTRPGGLREGVQRYIALSENDPSATDTLPGQTQPQDGSISVSLLDALRLVSLDFHAARILGMGLLDGNIQNDTDEFIYLGAYETEGALDDTNQPRPVWHGHMGLPTGRLDHRLPPAPELKPVQYGLTIDNGEADPSLLTDDRGYTPEGLSRWIDLYLQPEANVAGLGAFFQPPVEFCSTEKTSAVFFGVEYRKQGEATWRTPEIAHEAIYKDLDAPPQSETTPLPNNIDATKPILRHEETENGVHEYAAYSINWFSRSSSLSNPVSTDATLLEKAARLLPPANFMAQLIQQEAPLVLTTQAEQNMLAALPGPDHTLVRATFDYSHVHDVNYAYADTVEFFFRPDMPRNVVGAIVSVIDDPADKRKAVIRTTDYFINSQGAHISPTLAPALFGNFIGGMLSSQQENYVIAGVASSSQAGEGPVFTVHKNVRSNAADPGATGGFVTLQEYTAPDPNLSNSPLMFMAVENMADPASWGALNPLSSVVRLGDASWTVHQETYVQDGDTVTLKLRGIVALAGITVEAAALFPGVYRIAFNTYKLSHHSQQADADPVEWYKGTVRVARAADPNGAKRVLEVLQIEHLGDGQTLVLYVFDSLYDVNDQILIGANIQVSYYPGYKIYLHADLAHSFTEPTILPGAGEGNRKTWLGARARDTTEHVYSAVGIPSPVVALEFVEPVPPEQPTGGEFATWPDQYYKSSYTFRVNFGHKPFAVALYRGNDEAILRALYKTETYAEVRDQLRLLGEDDPFQADRWKNLVSFDYVYDNPIHPYFDPSGSNANGTFRKFPREDGFAFPNPDKGGALDGSTPGDVRDAVKESISGAFTPLTEVPLIYDFIKGPAYSPMPKPQRMRGADGVLLSPNNPDFDMAPMAKKTGNGSEVQFTDFTLDGTSNNLFFYFGREIGNRGGMSEPGPIGGPIQLINARPPVAPGVKKVYVQNLDRINNTLPTVNFEVSAYPDTQKVGRFLVYRATSAVDALAVRTMELVKTVDLAATNQLHLQGIRLSDDFENGDVPYGDPLFYRLVALRRVKNPAGGTEWTPSQSSKVLLTAVPDIVPPEAPNIGFTANGLSGTPSSLTGVTLTWPTTAYNSTYYLDKMNPAGDWITIFQIKPTSGPVVVDLAQTSLGTNVLPKEEAATGNPVFHHFRVRVRNSSSLFNFVERVLTI